MTDTVIYYRKIYLTERVCDASYNKVHLLLCRDKHKSIGYLYVYWYKPF